MENIAYIRIDNRKYINTKDKFYRIKNKVFNKISIEKINNGIIILVPKKCYNITEKFLNRENSLYNLRIEKQINLAMQKFSITKIACEETIIQLLKHINKTQLLNGKILMKYLITEILEYIYKYRNYNMALDDLYILVNEYNKENINIINKLANNFKSINIVTEKVSKFRRLEKFYEETGNLITISNNKRKSLRNAKMIINMEFDNNIFSKYTVNNNCVIINLVNDKLTFKKSFNGVCINDFEIIINKNMQNFIEEFYGNINVKILYESLIMNKECDAIYNFIEKENIIVNKIIGMRSVINAKEELKGLF